MRPGAFFDRDGVLNIDSGYIFKPQQWEWTPGAREAICWCNAHGYAVVVVTNQSGIGRGFYGAQDVEILHEFVQRELAEVGGQVDAFYYCPHLPEDNCACRKPLPGMILSALRDLDLDASKSFLIGDRESDIQASEAAEVRGILYSGGSLLDFVQANA